jgi:Protein of unknown function (DUF4231)
MSGPQADSSPEPPCEPEVHAASPHISPDMRDSNDDLLSYPSLVGPLKNCQLIENNFRAADSQAVKFQARHRAAIYIAAVAAPIAVVAAILELASRKTGGLLLGPGETVPRLVEPVAALVAVAAVAVGWSLRYQAKWLFYRHQAEQCRFLRYKFLTHPMLWSADPEKWIAGELSLIAGMPRHSAVKEAVNAPLPHGPFLGLHCRLPRPTLEDLSRYYLAKRLAPQKEYLANRAQRNEIKDWLRYYLPWGFFLSIVAVTSKVLMPRSGWGLSVVVVAGLLAALLPVVAAGFRTYLAAFEFSRNKSRFQSAHDALSDLERRLIDDTLAAGHGDQGQGTSGVTSFRIAENDDTDAYPVLRDLSWCELILRGEHLEWLRLMHDAEWFG